MKTDSTIRANVTVSILLLAMTMVTAIRVSAGAQAAIVIPRIIPGYPAKIVAKCRAAGTTVFRDITFTGGFALLRPGDTVRFRGGMLYIWQVNRSLSKLLVDGRNRVQEIAVKTLSSAQTPPPVLSRDQFDNIVRNFELALASPPANKDRNDRHLLFPVGDRLLDPRPTIVWTPDEHAVTQEVSVLLGTSGSTVLFIKTLEGTATDQLRFPDDVVSLAPGRYRVRLRSLDRNGNVVTFEDSTVKTAYGDEVRTFTVLRPEEIVTTRAALETARNARSGVPRLLYILRCMEKGQYWEAEQIIDEENRLRPGAIPNALSDRMAQLRMRDSHL